jgi:aminobenzoyl-glutamate utilization protein B
MSDEKISYESVDSTLDLYREEIDKLALDLWQLAEISFTEVKSSELILDLLEQHGFTITSRGTSGIPTAFVAEWGSGFPKLGILMEYDALPHLGNEAVSTKTPRTDGTVDGHGCGHNLIGAASFGAAHALKKVMEEHKIPGLLRLYGCAAEETEGAKVIWRGMDYSTTWMPACTTILMNMRWWQISAPQPVIRCESNSLGQQRMLETHLGLDAVLCMPSKCLHMAST